MGSIFLTNSLKTTGRSSQSSLRFKNLRASWEPKSTNLKTKPPRNLKRWKSKGLTKSMIRRKNLTNNSRALRKSLTIKFQEAFSPLKKLKGTPLIISLGISRLKTSFKNLKKQQEKNLKKKKKLFKKTLIPCMTKKIKLWMIKNRNSLFMTNFPNNRKRKLCRKEKSSLTSK